MIMIMITENTVTNWYVQGWKEKITMYIEESVITNIKDWDLIMSVVKLFQSWIDLE